MLTSLVNTEIKQLLYSKGFRYALNMSGRRMENSLAEERWNNGELDYAEISIAQVLDWLVKEHGIYIEVNISMNREVPIFRYKITRFKDKRIAVTLKQLKDFRESLEDTYTEGIIQTLSLFKFN